MAPSILSITTLCKFYILLYALSYPIVSNLALSNSSRGETSLPLQIYQLSVLAICVLLLFFNRSKNAKTFNLWFIIILFITVSTLSHLLGVDRANARNELTFSLKWVSWLVFFYTFTQLPHDNSFVKRLLFCFWIGALTYCFICIFFSQTSKIAETYSRYVEDSSVLGGMTSGKATLPCVVMMAMLSVYWFFNQKYRSINFVVLLLAVYIILKTYDRSVQLGCVCAYFYGIVWAYRNEKFKIAICLSIFLLIAIVFFGSTQGQAMLARWNTVEDDRGSGRMTFYQGSIDYFLNNRSPLIFFNGVGIFHTTEVMYNVSGLHIHTHSDFFDSLMVFGAFGVLAYFAIFYQLISYSRGLQRKSIEYNIMRSLVTFFFVTGFCTGIFAGIYVFDMLCIVLLYMRNEYNNYGIVQHELRHNVFS